jgi:5-carboxymethyl-2-hydroxymuconate isomerase
MPALRIEYAAELDETASWTEKMIARAFKPYFAYLDARAVFDLANTRSLLPTYDDWFPPLGMEYLERVVAVHRAAGWSRKEDPA